MPICYYCPLLSCSVMAFEEKKHYQMFMII